MKVRLMYPDQDFVVDDTRPVYTRDLEQDLGLDIVYHAAAQGDSLVHAVIRQALLSPLKQVDHIRYRQEVLADCLRAPDVIRELYRLTLETLETRRKNWLGVFSRSPSGVLRESVDLLKLLIAALASLQKLADTQGSHFESQGLTAFWTMIQNELDDGYFARIQEQFNYLSRSEIIIRAELGRDLKGTQYTLVRNTAKNGGMLERLRSLRVPSYTLHVDPRDDAGNRALDYLKDAALNPTANALAQSAEHILSFFQQLKIELAFFIGGLNLHDQITVKGEPWCIPQPFPLGHKVRHCRGLYDLALSLLKEDHVVGNDLDADNMDLIIVTGANQGGKTTFLRSMGLAQLMMQSGLFVPAQMFSANISTGIFTHFRREEDADMQSGKLDEELQRLSTMVDYIQPHSLVLFNESFASTNEREGAEILRQVTEALLECQVQVVSVSHLYAYTQTFYARNLSNAIFLRAERDRTFKLKPGQPLATSFGRDLYHRMFPPSQEG
ncbi:MAG: DNA mismatch repair protein MutS [Firmicutes bacterium]|nr:DNA mismatch repair protein MutS [Bacillota bacterium]